MLFLDGLRINTTSLKEINHRLVSGRKIREGRDVAGNSLNDGFPVSREECHRVNRLHLGNNRCLFDQFTVITFFSFFVLLNLFSSQFFLFKSKLDVFANPHVGDLHLVKGEGASLVSADVCGTAHNLASSQLLNVVIVLQHLTLGVGKRDHNSKGETFGDSDNDNGDTDNDIINPKFEVSGKGTALALNFTTEKIEVALEKAIKEVAEEKHMDGQKGSIGTNLSNLCGNNLEFHLEGSVSLLFLQLRHDLAKGRVVSNHDAKHLAVTRLDIGS